MTFGQLDIAPRTRGRAPKPDAFEYVRDLGEADLALLASERGTKPKTIAKLRDRHHALARCLSLGMKDAEASAATGYDLSRISILKRDPTFASLLEFYRGKHDAALGEFTERTTVLALTAVNELQERLEDDEDPLPASMVLEIAKFGADRTGHAPVQKQMQMNVNVDLGNRLNAARQRLAQNLAITSSSPIPESGDPGVADDSDSC